MSQEGPTIEVIASPEFKRRLKALTKRYRTIYSDLQLIFETLESGIFLGDQIPGTNYTVLKLCIPNSDTQSGKSGGYRLIYQIIEPQRIRLVPIYSKSEQENIATKTIREIIDSCSDE